jgi:two-component system, NtrC family, response regulator AtoC
MLTPLIGASRNIERIKELVHHVADTGLNIVITGESGVGKEVVAHQLHYHSPRRKKPFIKVNCAALPEGLLESELFGFERGAFTGAHRKKRGKFELAHNGVLFLDEIGDMSYILQAKLLQVLQSGTFTPLGSEKEVTTDAWVMAATNNDLEEKTKAGLFREDLYYRLNIVKIFISPLRQRPEDIPLLVDYYMDQYTSPDIVKRVVRPSGRVMEKLLHYPWPGNVRELQNVIQRMRVVGEWDDVVAELHSPNTAGKNEQGEDGADGASLSFLDYIFEKSNSYTKESTSLPLKKIRKKILDQVEKEVISFVLDKTGWNRTKASKILDVSYRTIINKISELNILPPKYFDND